MEIKTNHHYYPLLYFYELPEKIQKEMKENHLNEEYIEGTRFLKYKGTFYALHDFINSSLSKWDGILHINPYKAILIKLSNCGEAVKVATLYC